MGTATGTQTPRSGWIWSDPSGTALVRPDGTEVPVGIDTYTWAELQAAYPNGGAALLALAANTMVFVSDWQALFVRNTDGTYWYPVGGSAVLARLAAPVVHTGTVAETTVFTYAIPAALMNKYSGLRWRAIISAAANAGVTTVKWKFDTTQIDSNSCAVSGHMSPLTEYQNVGATNVGAYGFNLTYSTATTFQTANAFDFKVTFTLNSAADTTTLRGMHLELY